MATAVRTKVTSNDRPADIDFCGNALLKPGFQHQRYREYGWRRLIYSAADVLLVVRWNSIGSIRSGLEQIHNKSANEFVHLARIKLHAVATERYAGCILDPAAVGRIHFWPIRNLFKPRIATTPISVRRLEFNPTQGRGEWRLCNGVWGGEPKPRGPFPVLGFGVLLPEYFCMRRSNL